MSTGTYSPEDAFGLLRSFTRHVQFVREGIGLVTAELERRGVVHDASKMSDDEFAGFARINAAARINKFGSPEYSESMDRERPTIDLHFRRNSHHPEFHDQTFLDVIEMVCDWWGARKGYDDPRPWKASVALNLKAKGKHLTAAQIWLAEEVAAFLESTQKGATSASEPPAAAAAPVRGIAGALPSGEDD